MAQAGLELWRIQLFLRWGSAAVLGYLQDAPLTTSNAISTQVARGLDVKAIKHDILSEVKKTGSAQDESWLDRVRDIINEVLDGLSATDNIPSEQFVKQVLTGIGEQGPPEEKPAYIGPVYVLNGRFQSQCLHMAKDDSTTVCGWSYSTSPWCQTFDKQPTEKYRVCKQCKVSAL